jgi:hypothetical protein
MHRLVMQLKLTDVSEEPNDFISVAYCLFLEDVSSMVPRNIGEVLLFVMNWNETNIYISIWRRHHVTLRCTNM